MAVRDVALTLFIFGMLPLCFLKPWIGVLMWSWIGYMNPHRLCWGFAYDMPFAKVVAVATLAGVIMTKDRDRWPRGAEPSLLLVLWGMSLLSTALGAIDPEAAWAEFDRVSKILLMTLVTLVLFQNTKKLHVLIWVIALSVGFYGLKGGAWALLTGAENRVYGPPDSFIADNTDLGLALNMALPMFMFLRREERRRWVRHVLLALFGISVIAILGTYSRGALLGLAAVLAMLVFKSRMRLTAVVLAMLCVPVVGWFLPDEWFGRMQTIQTYEQDRSAMSRIEAWSVAFKLASDNPILGGGFKPFTPEIWMKYGGASSSLDAHSIFFQVLGEQGFTGLILYAGLILSTMVSLRRLIRATAERPNMQWEHDCANMLEVCMVGFLVNGLFLSRSYFDLFLHLVAMTVILKQLVPALQGRGAVAPPTSWRASSMAQQAGARGLSPPQVAA